MTAAIVSIDVAGWRAAHTILDLAYTGLDVVEREIAHFVFEAAEIHGGGCGDLEVWCRRRR